MLRMCVIVGARRLAFRLLLRRDRVGDRISESHTEFP